MQPSKAEKARQLISTIDEKLVAANKVLCPKMNDELKKLILVAGVTAASDSAFKEAEAAKTELMGNASLRLHQALTHFPTGQALVDAVDVEMAASSKDVHMLKEAWGNRPLCYLFYQPTRTNPFCVRWDFLFLG